MGSAGEEGTVVDVEPSLGPLPNTAAAVAPASARKAREKSARFVRLAELEPLAMAALRSGTEPVPNTAHSARDEHESERVTAGEDGEKTRNEDSCDSDTSMDAILRACHIGKGSPDAVKHSQNLTDVPTNVQSGFQLSRSQ